MRILHLLGAEADSGGILSVIRNLQEATAGRSVQHTVWVNRRYREVRRPSLEYRYSRWLLQEFEDHWGSILRSAMVLVELGRLQAQERFDVLHAHSRGSLLPVSAYTGMVRRPALFSNHAYARRVGLYRWAARRRFLHTSLLTPNMARHYGLSLADDRIHLVPDCCADRFFAAPLRAAPARDPGAPIRLVGLGNLQRWKKWRLVIEAFTALTPRERCRFEFVHWGPEAPDPDGQAYAAELRRLVRDGGLDSACTFRGLSLDVTEALREADFLILPSTNEPCSVALSEALALGIPAVVSASGGNVDTVQPDRTGLFFEPDNANSLAAQLRRILRNEVRMLSPAEIRESVRGRGATAVAEDCLRIYGLLAASAAARTPGARSAADTAR